MTKLWYAYSDNRDAGVHVLASDLDDAAYYAAVHFDVRVFDVVVRYLKDVPATQEGITCLKSLATVPAR